MRGCSRPVEERAFRLQRFAKSKNTAKSDWSRRFLSESQLLYAANDAYVAAVVYDALLSGGTRRRS